MKLIAPLILPLALAAPMEGSGSGSMPSMDGSGDSPSVWSDVQNSDLVAQTSCPALSNEHVADLDQSNYKVVYSLKQAENPEKPKLIAHVMPVACNEQLNAENAEEAGKQHEKNKAMAKKAAAKAEKLSQKADAKAAKAAKKAEEKKAKDETKAAKKAEKEAKKAQKQKEKADKLAQKLKDKEEKEAQKEANKKPGKKPAGDQPASDDVVAAVIEASEVEGSAEGNSRAYRSVPDGAEAEDGFHMKASMVMKFTCKKNKWTAVKGDKPKFSCSDEPVKEVAEVLKELEDLEAEMAKDDEYDMEGSGMDMDEDEDDMDGSAMDKDEDDMDGSAMDKDEDDMDGSAMDKDEDDMDGSAEDKDEDPLKGTPMEEVGGASKGVESEGSEPAEEEPVVEEEPKEEEDTMLAVHQKTCQQMMSHWDPVLETCVKNECDCANGVPSSPCPNQGDINCESCFEGFELKNDHTCGPAPEEPVAPEDEEPVEETASPRAKVGGMQQGAPKAAPTNEGRGKKRGKKYGKGKGNGNANKPWGLRKNKK